MVIIVDIATTRERVTEAVTTNLLWYDQETKQMVSLKGGQLAFRYADGKMVVSSQPLFSSKYTVGSNRSAIMKWFTDHEEEYGLQIINGGTHHIAMSYNGHDREIIEESLYEHRFEYEILG